MPVSRIAFALGDLMNEVRRLRPRDAAIKLVLHMDGATYDAAVSELEHHYGQKLAHFPIAGGTAVKVSADLVLVKD